MKNLSILIILTVFLNCASATPESGNTATPGMVDIIKEKAESEQGKKVIETIKEKAQDKELQNKVKGMLGGNKEEKK